MKLSAGLLLLLCSVGVCADSRAQGGDAAPSLPAAKSKGFTMPVTVSFKHKDKAYRAIYFVHERGHSPLVVFSESDGAKVGLRMDHNKNATVFCEGEEGEFPIGGPCVAVYSAGVLSITANAWPKEAELDRKTLEACARAALDQVEAMAAKLREKDGETSMFPARKTP